MAVETQLLETIEVFQVLNREELAKIAQVLRVARVTEGEVVIRRKDRATNFYVVLSGNFMISFKDDKAMTLHNKGDIMGWSTIIPPFKYKGTCVALTKGEVLTLSGQDFSRLTQSDQVLGDKIMKKINSVVTDRRPFFIDDAEVMEDASAAQKKPSADQGSTDVTAAKPAEKLAEKPAKPEEKAQEPADDSTKILAPMPGMIVRYEKDVGDEVKEGETVVILEAMKMENALSSPKSGTIIKINFSSGDSVAKDDILCVIG